MKISPKVVGWLLYPVYCLWCWTLRYTESGRERVDHMNDARDLMVFSMWHNEVFPIMYTRRQLRIVAIVSRSNDGEFLARLLQALGMKTARGSSSRGGQSALIQTANLMKAESYNACLTIDGPRGPRHEPKNGAIFLAYHAKAAIVPMRVFMKKAKIFRSWDKFRLPLPFSRVHVAFDAPYYLDCEELNDAMLAAACAQLKEKLDAMAPPEEGFLDD